MVRRRSADDGEITGPIAAVPAPAPRKLDPTDAILVVLQPSSASPGRRYSLSEDEHIVGRRPDVAVPLDLASVSRQHARFLRDGHSWIVEDLDSTNGTFVNDERVDRIPLRDGDIIRVGEAVLKFLSGSSIEVAYHEEIYRLSILDGLTGVHNKLFFLEYLERELARAWRHNATLSLVLFDVDHFKQVNDVHGHPAGDAVLIQLCRRLRQRIRREELLARIGGEEFGCILADTPKAGATTFAEQLRVLVEREPFRYDEKVIPVTISLGVATIVAGEKIDPQDLVRAADEKLYEAKRNGRNRVAS